MPTHSNPARKAPAKRAPAKKTAAKSTAARSTSTTNASAASRARRASEAALAANAPRSGPVTSASELAGEAVSAVRPDGMPHARSVVGLGRRDKAAVTRVLGAITKRFGSAGAKLEAAVDRGDDEAASQVAAQIAGSDPQDQAILTMELLADLEEILVVVAEDSAAMRAWVDAATDEELMQAWSWYSAEYPLGEAFASPS